MKKISTEVQKAREKSGKSIADFAKMYDISESLLKRYEYGKHDNNPSVSVLTHYCQNFNIDPNDLFDYDFNIDKTNETKINDLISSVAQMLKKDNIDTPKEVIVKLFTKLKYSSEIKSIQHCGSTFYTSFFFDDNNIVACKFYEYKVIRDNIDILRIYKELHNDLLNVIYKPMLVSKSFNDEKKYVKNIILALSNPKAFKRIYLDSLESWFGNTNKYPCPVNVTLLYTPVKVKSDPRYINIIGDDFINNTNFIVTKDSDWLNNISL